VNERSLPVLLLAVAVSLSGPADARAGGSARAVLGQGIPDLPWVGPGHIDIMGTRNGVVDPYGTFTVIPLGHSYERLGPGMLVTIEFQCPDIAICAPGPTIAGQTPSCFQVGDHKVAAYTDADGVAAFDIAGAGRNTGGSAGCHGAGARIWLNDSYIIGEATVAVYDENGAVSNAGVDGTDASVWLRDFGQQPTAGNRSRSDYNGDGVLSGVDLGLWLRIFGRQDSREGCAGHYCP
jgi:hypothetical protein